MKRWQWLLGILALGILVVELAHSPASDHEPLWWESIPYFFGILGFVGCIAIIFISKLIGKLLLLKEEDYYDEP